MPGSFVGADAGGGNVQIVTDVVWPSGLLSGDIAVMPWVFQNTQAPTDPTSDAFTLVTDQQDGSARLRLLYRKLTGSESGAIAGWSSALANRQAITLCVFRGFDDISGFAFQLEGITAVSVHDNPPITTADGFGSLFPANGDSLMVITATRDGATVTATPPAGFAKRTGAEIGFAGGGGTHVAVADDGLLTGVSLPVDPAAWTGYAAASANAVTVTLALRPKATPFVGFGIPF